jgi:1,4-alpha-glucan branching enzyme
VMSFRGSPRGEPSRFLPPEAFIAFTQNHDQIGNRALGERITALACAEACRAIAAICLLLPQIPMLFMGEEWGSRQPFPFFCDFEGELANAVRDGRRKEFSHLPEFADPQSLLTIPDPLSESTYRSAVLRWEDQVVPEHAARLEWYRQVLAVRRTEIIPILNFLTGDDTVSFVRGPSAVTIQWRHGAGCALQLDANLSSVPCEGFSVPPGRTLWLEGGRVARRLDPWTVHWSAIE